MNKQKILQAGIKAWHKNPQSVTASQTGRMIGLTHAGVLYHFPKGLKDAVAAYAVEIGDKRIVPQLIVCRHPATKAMTLEERAKFLNRMF